MTQLVRAQDTPTHRLTVKLEDGTFRVFYLTEKESVWILQNINSVEPFIQLPRSVDPNAPSFYPKRGAWLERMSREEIEARIRRYEQKAKPERDEEAEKKKAEDSARVRVWINAHPAEFAELEKKAAEKLQSGSGLFQHASKGTKRSLIRYEAMRAVFETIASAPMMSDLRAATSTNEDLPI